MHGFLTHSTSLRAGSEGRLWLWLGFRRVRSRVDGETGKARSTRLKLCGWAERGRDGERRRWRRSRVEGSSAGLVLRIKAGLGEQFLASRLYLCEGGPSVRGYRHI